MIATDNSLSDELLEHRDNSAFHENAGALEHGDYWRFANLFRHSLIQNWMQHQLSCHLHFSASQRLAHLKPGEYCANFERPSKLLVRNNRRGPANRKVKF